MGLLQGLINLIFLVVVAGTIIFSVWLSRKYKERYAEFPWYKAVIILVVEIVAWIVTNSFMDMVRRHPWLLAIALVIIIVVLIKRKKKKESVL